MILEESHFFGLGMFRIFFTIATVVGKNFVHPTLGVPLLVCCQVSANPLRPARFLGFFVAIPSAGVVGIGISCLKMFFKEKVTFQAEVGFLRIFDLFFEDCSCFLSAPIA